MTGWGGRAVFVGAWPAAERRVVEAAVRSVEEYLGAPLPSAWRFEKTAGGYLVSQAALLLRRRGAGTVGKLVGLVLEAAEFAAPPGGVDGGK